jgi:hypothetical protein
MSPSLLHLDRNNYRGALLSLILNYTHRFEQDRKERQITQLQGDAQRLSTHYNPFSVSSALYDWIFHSKVMLWPLIQDKVYMLHL